MWIQWKIWANIWKSLYHNLKAAMEIAFVVSGKLDAYMSMRLAPWDIGGGVIIAKEVGAIATNLKGKDFDYLSKDTFLIANPSVHQLILDKYIEVKK